VAGDLVTLVDHLFAALIATHPDAVVHQREFVIEIPRLFREAREMVDTDRARGSLQATDA
jgi:hypothetical protein